MKASALSTPISLAYGILVKAASSLTSPFLLVVRVYWGWQFFGTGKGKLGDIQKVAAFFSDLHIPFPTLNAVLAGTTECVGGLLLIAGLATRLTAIPLIFTMIVAYLTAENESLRAIFSEPDKFTGATPFLFLFACVIIFIFGPGAFSFDWLIGWFHKHKTGAAQNGGSIQEPAKV